jgi:hypothetical protein
VALLSTSFLLALYNHLPQSQMKSIILPSLFVLICAPLISFSQSLPQVVNNFSATLSGDQKKKAFYEFKDEERFNFNFVPIARNGVPLADLSEIQKEKVWEMLKAFLSTQGFNKAQLIVQLEPILKVLEKRAVDDNYRDPAKYYITQFGTPENPVWGWRFEGHHLSLNFSCRGEEIISATPSFMGSNPAIVPSGEKKGLQVLEQEQNLGFELINSMTPAQMKIARFSETAPPEILNGNQRKAKALEPIGIKYTELTKSQQSLLLKLLDVYVKNYQLGFSKTLMKKIETAGIENLSFGWAGSLAKGEGHYYRIQGPMLLVEYDNTQTNANHVHSCVRDLTNDFAEDILREHYQKEHQK